MMYNMLLQTVVVALVMVYVVHSAKVSCNIVDSRYLSLSGGARSAATRARKSNNLGFRSMVKAFWLSLIDPGNEEALLQSKSSSAKDKKETRKGNTGWFSSKGKSKSKGRR